ncbi:MAG: Rrf2 family transcriptional regulator [Candidatus Cloacimonetes bacterium]|nr:Rrf2 family transcriptional regulator [Candidatus Cloacimonadota bacterium]
MSVKLSTKCRYGTRAITEIARGWPDATVKKRQISQRQTIPASYLENILLELKRSGLVTATRGAKGGYRLTRAPEDICVLDILSAFGDSLVPVDCVDDPDCCSRTKRCVFRHVWMQLHKAQEEALSGVTVQDLIDEENEM